MTISLQQQTTIFLYSCVVGVGLGVLYDVFRILRIAFKTPAFIIFFEDMIYFSACGVITFLYIFQSSSGMVRGFIIIGEFLGAVLYYFTVGALVIKLAAIIISFIKRVLRFIYKLIFEPIIKFFNFIAGFIYKLHKINLKFVQKIFNYFKNCLKVLCRLLYNVTIVQILKIKPMHANEDGEKPNENG